MQRPSCQLKNGFLKNDFISERKKIRQQQQTRKKNGRKERHGEGKINQRFGRSAVERPEPRANPNHGKGGPL